MPGAVLFRGVAGDSPADAVEFALFPPSTATLAAMTPKTSLSYRDAGVDIDAGDALVDRIKPLARKTLRDGVLGASRGGGDTRH